MSCVSIWVFQAMYLILKSLREKTKQKINAQIISYRYMDNCVFASLANGDVLIYQRTPSNYFKCCLNFGVTINYFCFWIVTFRWDLEYQ